MYPILYFATVFYLINKSFLMFYKFPNIKYVIFYYTLKILKSVISKSSFKLILREKTFHGRYNINEYLS